MALPIYQEEVQEWRDGPTFAYCALVEINVFAARLQFDIQHSYCNYNVIDSFDNLQNQTDVTGLLYSPLW